MGIQQEYLGRTRKSRSLYCQAVQVIPGGAGSTERTRHGGWDPYPPFIRSGNGSRLVNADGEEYVDYMLGLGPCILGHRHPVVTQAVTSAITEYGTCFALPYELEAEAAAKVVAAVPGIDLIRFANSGSEAVGAAVRLARAFTGRPLVIRFEGQYHGTQDTVYWSDHVDPRLAGPKQRPHPIPAGKGVPAQLADTLIVLSWNDQESLRRVMAERGDQVAAILTEPIMFNAGCLLPDDGQLAFLRQQATQYGALLIFDEVVTGFRVSRGGAQELFQVAPDLTVLAKALGGGFPVAALGGRRPVMEMISNGEFRHSGTYNGNVVQCAAVSATMDVLSQPGLYDRQGAHARRLAQGLRELAQCAGLPVTVTDVGLSLGIAFSDQPARDWREARQRSRPDMFRAWHRRMLLRRVLFHPNEFEPMFLSMAHRATDIDTALDAAGEAFAALAHDFSPRRLVPLGKPRGTRRR